MPRDLCFVCLRHVHSVMVGCQHALAGTLSVGVANDRTFASGPCMALLTAPCLPAWLTDNTLHAKLATYTHAGAWWATFGIQLWPGLAWQEERTLRRTCTRGHVPTQLDECPRSADGRKGPRQCVIVHPHGAEVEIMQQQQPLANACNLDFTTTVKQLHVRSAMAAYAMRHAQPWLHTIERWACVGA